MTQTPTKEKGKSSMIAFWQSLGTKWLPFADAASEDLPLGRLLRLAMFQISVGMAAVLLTGTLNRVMIVELGVPAWLVASVVAIPLLVAPFRILIGHRSDTYRSLLGWRRVPYIWLGSMLQFGGLAIMPFALLLLNSQTVGPQWAGPVGAALAFLLTGAGMHMTQTAGLALATDLAAEENRPRVVALTYVMLLIGMMLAAAVYAVALTDFSAMRLIQVIQASALATIVINLIALWKQEPRNAQLTRKDRKTLSFADALRVYRNKGSVGRLLLAVGLGAAAFSMQDVLLEPYGGEVLGLNVSQTTALTAIWAIGTLAGFFYAGRALAKGSNLYRVAANGCLIGLVAFSCVIFAEPLQSANLFRFGVFLIGFGGGLFAVSTMLAAMECGQESDSGIVIGAWGAVQATSIGLALAIGGFVRDGVNALVATGFGDGALSLPVAGYSVVYHLEIGILFTTLAVLGPLAGEHHETKETTEKRSFGLAELPG